MSHPNQNDQAAPQPAHAFNPIPVSVIHWCQLSTHLAKWPAQAWAFIYMDCAANKPVGLQAVRTEDIPKLVAATFDSSKQAGWQALEWADVMPEGIDKKDYPAVLLAAMQRRRKLLMDQLDLLNQQIQAQQAGNYP